MLKSTALGTYWQDRGSKGSSFTRVRCISNGAQVEPQVYGSWRKKTRAYTVPDTSCKMFQRFRRKTCPVNDPVQISNDINTRKNTVEGIKTTSVRNRGKKTELKNNSGLGVEIEIEMPPKKEMESRLPVCKLDTEQIGGSESGEEVGSNKDEGEGRGSGNHSRKSSVDKTRTRSTVHSFCSSQSCQGCGMCFEASDKVVVFESDPYHMQCFACGNCGLQVDPTLNFLVLDTGNPLCKVCSPTCHSCGEKIVSGHLNVLNKDFHEECLKCFICKKMFGTINKVYASSGEPCCAECVTPVFNDAWSPKRLMKESPSLALRTHQEEREPAGAELTSASCCSHSLPPRLESLSHAVNELPTTRLHTLLRPSVSVPTSLTGGPSSRCRGNSMSLSSLRAILSDELGVSLLMNFCMDDCSIELVVFWLDAEHFRHFDGNDDDIRLFAHHIMMKYIGYYAELPINLPSDIEDKITAGIQTSSSCDQGLFAEAQAYVLDKMERDMHPKFLRSTDGQQFLEALVKRDINRRKKKRELEMESQVFRPMKATVVSFDKRYEDTKFYIYSIQVEDDGKTVTIYRRYSDFYSLHQTLKLSFPDLKLPMIPKKIYFGRSQTRNVAGQRMKDLDSYLQGLLSQPAELQSEILRSFLTQTPSDKADEAFDTRLRNTRSS